MHPLGGVSILGNGESCTGIDLIATGNATFWEARNQGFSCPRLAQGVCDQSPAGFPC